MLWKSNVRRAPRSDLSSSAFSRSSRSRRSRGTSSRLSQSTPVVPKVGDTMGTSSSVCCGELCSTWWVAGGAGSGEPCLDVREGRPGAQVLRSVRLALVLEVVRDLDKLQCQSVWVAEVHPAPARQRTRVDDVHVGVELDALGLELRLRGAHVGH